MAARNGGEPDRFMRETLPGALRAAASRLATFLGAVEKDLAFVENASAAVNAVLRSMTLQPEEEILATNHTYAAVQTAIRFVCEATGARYVEAQIGLPVNDEDDLAGPVLRCLTERTRLVVLDHVASPTGLIFPLRRLIEACKQRGAKVLVDGAHAPGQLAVHVPALHADWYVGNCHKWLFAPKGCGFLWAEKSHQSSLAPLVISHGYGQGFKPAFEWPGTRDFSAWLAVTDALDFLEAIGPDRMRAHNHAVAVEAAQALGADWRTPVDGPPSLHGSMISVCLPARLQALGANAETARRLQSSILRNHGLAVAITAASGVLWLRISGQIYNSAADYQTLNRIGSLR